MPPIDDLPVTEPMAPASPAPSPAPEAVSAPESVAPAGGTVDVAVPEQPVADAAAPAETAAETPKAESSTSLLGEILKEKDAAGKTEPEKVPDPSQIKEAPAPALEPVAYEYSVPETLKMDDVQKTEFTKALDAFRADPTKGAQAILDMGTKAMENYAQGLAQEQMRVWNDTRKGWREQVLQDPMIGGSGHPAAMSAIARMRDYFVSDKDRQAFNEMLEVTGVGDHPQMLKFIYNVSRFFDEPAPPAPNPAPPPDNGRSPVRGMRSLYRSG